MDLEIINEKLDYLIENMTEKKEVFTAKEAAEYLCMDYTYLTEIAKAGEIRHKRKGDGKNSPYLFKREWLDEWLEN